ncbi:interleukin-8-like [Pristis pectinata]|uniref:interleukin-8-like n=1 Tax=Pristis pectinata TaxID=685728 RepID=UPI00223CD2F3|nr:interleukin-8-like [Pristis pectinata]
MNSATTMTILILLLCAIAAQGIPIIEIQGRCQCILSTKKFINPKYMWRVKYVPSGFHCETPEIIIQLKSGKKICVDPKAKWLKIIFKAKKGAKPWN